MHNGSCREWEKLELGAALVLNENKDNASSSGAYAGRSSIAGSRVSAFSDLHAAPPTTALPFISRRFRTGPILGIGEKTRRGKKRPRTRTRIVYTIYRLLTVRPTAVRPRACIHRTSCVQQHRCASRYRCLFRMASTSLVVSFSGSRPSERCFLFLQI